MKCPDDKFLILFLFDTSAASLTPKAAPALPHSLAGATTGLNRICRGVRPMENHDDDSGDNENDNHDDHNA